MVRILFLSIFLLSFVVSLPVFPLFNSQEKEVNKAENDSKIPVIFNADKHIRKRQKEAYKLVLEGRELIKKGKKKKDQSLITKGQIKKEIGEKQLQLLKEQVEERKRQDNELQ